MAGIDVLLCIVNSDWGGGNVVNHNFVCIEGKTV